MKKNRLFVLLLIMSLLMATFTACGGSGGSEPAEEEAAVEEETATVEDQVKTVEDAAMSQAAGAMIDKDAIPVAGYTTVSFGGLDFDMPDCFTYQGEDSGNTIYAAETDQSFVFLQFSTYNSSFSESEFPGQGDQFYEGYTSTLKDSGQIADFTDGGSVEARTQVNGYQCMLYACSGRIVANDVPFNNIIVLINNPAANKTAVISLMQSSKSQYDYTGAFGTMVDTCKPSN